MLLPPWPLPPNKKMIHLQREANWWNLYVFVLSWSHSVALLKYLFFLKGLFLLNTSPFYYFWLVEIHHEYLNLKDELDSKSAPHVSQLSLFFKLYMHFLYLYSDSFFTLSQSEMGTIHLVVLDLFLNFVIFFQLLPLPGRNNHFRLNCITIIFVNWIQIGSQCYFHL